MRLLLVPLGGSIAICVAHGLRHVRRTGTGSAAMDRRRLMSGGAACMLGAGRWSCRRPASMLLPAIARRGDRGSLRDPLVDVPRRSNGGLSRLAVRAGVDRRLRRRPYDLDRRCRSIGDRAPGIAAGFAYWADRRLERRASGSRCSRRRIAPSRLLADRPPSRYRKSPGEGPAISCRKVVVRDDQRRGSSARADAAFEPFGERRDGLGVDHRPCSSSRIASKFGSPSSPALAALPAVALEIVRGGGEHVRHAVDEVAAAVAVEVDRVFVIGRRQELGLAEVAGPVAAHFGRRQVAAVDDAKRVDQLRPGTCSVRRQSNASVATERITSFLPRLTPKSVSRPQIATDDRARHAELLLDLATASALAPACGAGPWSCGLSRSCGRRIPRSSA